MTLSASSYDSANMTFTERCSGKAFLTLTNDDNERCNAGMRQKRIDRMGK